MMLALARPDLCSTTRDIKHEDMLGEALWRGVMRPHDPPVVPRVTSRPVKRGRGTVNQEACDGDK
jgi:hypothetical protein